MDLKGGNPREMPAIGPAFISRRCVSVPGGDLHVLSNVRHDWEDDEAKRIVANCHRAWSVTKMHNGWREPAAAGLQ